MTPLLSILTAVVNSLWQALAVTALVWLVLRFARRINAATRYAIWWATLGVVLILPVAPRLISVIRTHPQPVALATAKPPSVTLAPVIVEPVVVTVPPDRMAIWPLAVAAIWAAILLWRLYQIGRSYVYLRGVKRRSAVSVVPLPAIPRHADLLISRDIVSPMAVGFLRPAIILPEALVPELSEPERDHVLLHESAHLAKYDDWINLAMRILGGILALHPIAIWILRRIEREREMACDDWVVARTGSARPYAASLARLVELRQAARREMLASGLFGPGSKVGDRIELLLQRDRIFSSRASTRDVVISATALIGLMLAGSLAPRWIAFAQDARPRFEVASIKPNSSGLKGVCCLVQPGGRLHATSATLKSMIEWAYGVQDYQISGGPTWLDSAGYDILAEPEHASNPNWENRDYFRQMVQGLLAERFSLRLQRETKDLPIYELTIAKNGPKMKAFERPQNAGDTRIHGGKGQLIAEKLTMNLLAQEVLSNVLGRPVVDKTGLTAWYDFKLEWTPDEGVRGPDGQREGAGDAAGPSIFSAVQDQLGLKLESTRGPVEILVIERAEKPDAN
ncbi:MAG TPA: M56 and DUF3738 domain-containing protein [Bryobacteraceae bacterium]|jgi:uncharacterized protein (TIGR03435 family)|nr:M56 and DUF3738 domain-containing protein [Bryobacteraceae bacterium]